MQFANKKRIRSIYGFETKVSRVKTKIENRSFGGAWSEANFKVLNLVRPNHKAWRDADVNGCQCVRRIG